jgi:hypothetical protein
VMYLIRNGLILSIEPINRTNLEHKHPGHSAPARPDLACHE